MIIAPQAGPQEAFLSSPADIVIYGGAAGGGKSYGLLLEPLRHISNGLFGAVVFRKNANQIFSEGGLWDTATGIYPYVGAIPIKNPRPTWRFPSGAKITFAHLEYEKDVLGWQGSQIAMIAFDELTHFTRGQFFYMLSRNRSTCGIRPYIRATTNPDADSWVADFISWWWDPETGYPIQERSGKLRYMVMRDNVIHWGDTPEELSEAMGCELQECKSVTFIASKLTDNKILMENDPGYLANLKALPLVERERLLDGNWKIRPAAGLYFKRVDLGEILDDIPADVIRWVRGWDLAATAESEGGEPAYTAGVLIGKRKNGRYVVADVVNIRVGADEARRTIKLTGQMDKNRFMGKVKIRLPQDPGQAGKDQAKSYIKYLAGFNVVAELESGSKITRAEPMAAQWQAGNFDIVKGTWNSAYLDQLESFPEGKFKDMVDASNSAFNELEKSNVTTPPKIGLQKASYWRGV